MRRAFTLIEVMVVCGVLVLLASLVLPNVVGMKANRERQAAYDNVLRLAQAGRETAIQSGHGYALTLSGTTVELNRTEDAETNRDGQAATTATPTVSTVTLPTGVVVGSDGEQSTSQNGSSGDSTTDGTSVSLPSGASVGQVVLDDKPSTTTDFTLHFYPDGRSEGGGFEMVDGGATKSLVVDRNGIATLQDGNLPATTESSWEAGQYEQRASG